MFNLIKIEFSYHLNTDYNLSITLFSIKLLAFKSLTIFLSMAYSSFSIIIRVTSKQAVLDKLNSKSATYFFSYFIPISFNTIVMSEKISELSSVDLNRLSIFLSGIFYKHIIKPQNKYILLSSIKRSFDGLSLESCNQFQILQL